MTTNRRRESSADQIPSKDCNTHLLQAGFCPVVLPING